MNSDFSVKKKLELMQQIRSRYQQDKNDMFHRERILYGKSRGNADTETDPPAFSSFPLRLFLAVAVFVLIVLGDKTGSGLFGLSSEECFQAISQDYESSIAAWADAASRAIINNRTYDDRPLKDNPPAGVRP